MGELVGESRSRARQSSGLAYSDVATLAYLASQGDRRLLLNRNANRLVSVGMIFDKTANEKQSRPHAHPCPCSSCGLMLDKFLPHIILKAKSNLWLSQDRSCCFLDGSKFVGLKL